MNRGLRHTTTFLTDTDRHVFIDLARDACEQSGTIPVAYCLMGNHYHLVMHCPDGGLSEAIHLLAGRYTRSFNRANGFDGPLFRSRFHSVPITTDEQLLGVTRYVHRNPLELGLRIDDYPWSSYRDYLEGTRSWIDPSVPVTLAGGPASYRDFVETPLPADTFTLADGMRTAPVSILEPARSDDGLQALDQLVADRVEPDAKPLRTRNIAIVAALACGRHRAEAIAAHHGLRSASSVRATASVARRHIAMCTPCASTLTDILNVVLPNRRAA